MLRIKNLTKKFGSCIAINNLNFEITEPGLYIFVGVNGSGKTTLFNLVSGLILPDFGEICLNGIHNPDKIRSLTGISTEPFITEPSLSVAEIAQICQQIKKAKKANVEKWLTFWELQPVKEKAFKTLSTGMKKRLTLALSLFGNPDYLFWDEPFNGLDPLGIEILNQLTDQLISQGKYILISTHLLNELTSTRATYYVIKDGELAGTISHDNKNTHEKIINLLKQK